LEAKKHELKVEAENALVNLLYPMTEATKLSKGVMMESEAVRKVLATYLVTYRRASSRSARRLRRLRFSDGLL